MERERRTLTDRSRKIAWDTLAVPVLEKLNEEGRNLPVDRIKSNFEAMWPVLRSKCRNRMAIVLAVIHTTMGKESSEELLWNAAGLLLRKNTTKGGALPFHMPGKSISGIIKAAKAVCRLIASKESGRQSSTEARMWIAREICIRMNLPEIVLAHAILLISKNHDGLLASRMHQNVAIACVWSVCNRLCPLNCPDAKAFQDLAGKDLRSVYEIKDLIENKGEK